MSALRRFAAVLLAACSFPFAAHAAVPSMPIPVFGTGVNQAGGRAQDGDLDPHYVIASRPGEILSKPIEAYVVSNRADGAWMGNSGTAKWISHSPNQRVASPPVCYPGGTYVYRTTFDLTGLNPATAVLNGAWAADNSGVRVRLNGNVLAITAAGFTAFAPFTITTGFVPGVNTLEFDVGDTGCPTGVIIQLSGTALPALNSQQITFAQPPDRHVGDAPLELFAYVNSGGPVTFTSQTPATCSVAGKLASVLAAGTCTIAADQPGFGGAPAAPQVVRSFNVAPLLDPSDLASYVPGALHTCAVTPTGGVRCQGANEYGALGVGATPLYTPGFVDVGGLGGVVTSVVVGDDHTCALTAAGGVKCWGWVPQLGGVPASAMCGENADVPCSPVPVTVPGLGSGVVALSSGRSHVCAVLADGRVACWGANQSGQLGKGNSTPGASVNFVVGPGGTGQLSGIVSMVAGPYHTCALNGAGEVYCWGLNTASQLGVDTTSGTCGAVCSFVPVLVPPVAGGVASLSLGLGTTCAITLAGGVTCWGAVLDAAITCSVQLGFFCEGQRPLAGLTSRVVALAVGSGFACAVTLEGAVLCWGYNDNGQLGQTGFPSRFTPDVVPGLAADAALLFASDLNEVTCALTRQGGVKCWGKFINGVNFVPGLEGVHASPAAIGFPSRTVPIGTAVTSATIVPQGFFDPAPLSITGGEYSIGCTGTFATAPAVLLPGQSVCVRTISSVQYSTTEIVTLFLGNTAAILQVTTLGPPQVLVTASSFTFGPQPVGTASAVQQLTLVSIGDHPLLGLTAGSNGDFAVRSSTCPASLAKDASCAISIAFEPSVVGTRAGELFVFATNLAQFERVLLTGIGTASDATPGAFSFVDQFAVPLSSVRTSAPVQVTGLSVAAPASVIGGQWCASSAPGCACDATPFGTQPGSVQNNQYVCVRHTSSSQPGESVDTQFILGGVGDTFTSVTIDTVPAQFSLGAQANVAPGTMRTSAAAAIAGINAPAPFEVVNGDVSVNCTGAFAKTGTLAPGSAICARHVAASGYNARTTTTVTIGGVSADFVSTTFDAFGDIDGDGIPNGVEFNEAKNPEAKDNDVFGSARLFAMQQYRDFLGREGDAGGIQFYMDLLTSGAAERANVIEGFFNSPEFAGAVSPIARLYFATFRRVPDYDGLIFQVNAYRSGAPLAGIATNFTLSPEFQAAYGNKTDAQYVQLLYTNILGRAASQGEIDFHVNRLVAGASRGDVLVGFSESPEYQQATFNEVYVTMMYVGMLRRAPDPAGFDFWLAYMDGGNPGLALILGFLQAPEYRNRFLP